MGWGRQSAARPRRRQHPSPAELAVQLGQAARRAECGWQKTPPSSFGDLQPARRMRSPASSAVAHLLSRGSIGPRGQTTTRPSGACAAAPVASLHAPLPLWGVVALGPLRHNFRSSFLHAVIWLMRGAACRYTYTGVAVGLAGAGGDCETTTLSLVPRSSLLIFFRHCTLRFRLLLGCCTQPRTR